MVTLSEPIEPIREGDFDPAELRFERFGHPTSALHAPKSSILWRITAGYQASSDPTSPGLTVVVRTTTPRACRMTSRTSILVARLRASVRARRISNGRPRTVCGPVRRAYVGAAATVFLVSGCSTPKAPEHRITIHLLWQRLAQTATEACAGSVGDRLVERWGGVSFTIGNGGHEVLAEGTLGTHAQAVSIGGGAFGCALAGTVIVPDSGVYTASIDGVTVSQTRTTVAAAGWAMTISLGINQNHANA